MQLKLIHLAFQQSFPAPSTRSANTTRSRCILEVQGAFTGHTETQQPYPDLLLIRPPGKLLILLLFLLYFSVQTQVGISHGFFYLFYFF